MAKRVKTQSAAPARVLSAVEAFPRDTGARAGGDRGPSATERALLHLLDRLEHGKLSLALPSGHRALLSGKQDRFRGHCYQADMQLQTVRAIPRLLLGGDLGLAETYMAGHWDSSDLTHLLEMLACNLNALERPSRGLVPSRLWRRMWHWLRGNTLSGSRRNIAYHYDLGNDFYAHWLDGGMSYSAAQFDAAHTSLEAAQENKYRRLAEMLQLRPWHRVLEIGCGWGGFAEFAARHYGCQVVGITLSKAQLAYARQRIAAAGLADRVTLRLQDYRETAGSFDRIVSIEMFEAVGERYWPTYFAQLRRCLVPGGLAALQVITIARERFEAYRQNPEFIQKYIFPGGMLPTAEALHAGATRAGLAMCHDYRFGDSYAETLRRWRDAFDSRWPAINAMGFPKRFKRMWDYYLCYCEAGFNLGTIDVGHYLLERPMSPAIHNQGD